MLFVSLGINIAQAEPVLPAQQVTATRLPTTPAAATQSVTLLSRADLAALHGLSLSDILRRQAGIVIDRSSASGGYGSLYLRGADPSHTVVLIDGVRQNDPLSSRGSAVDLNTLSIDDIERIEIVRGNASVSGTLGKDMLVATRFMVAYSSDKDAHRTEIEFRDGNVLSATNEPKRRKTAPDWVPLSAQDMRAVLDPLSGMVFPAGSKVCPRSLPIFDGQTRVTLHLTPKGVRPFSTKGFKGDAIVCGIRFDPKAGYRKGSSGIVYLRQLKTMEVWFARHERGGLYAPVYARVPTKIGEVIVAATQFDG